MVNGFATYGKMVGLLAWHDRNGDGKIQYASGATRLIACKSFDGYNRAEDGHKVNYKWKKV